MILRLRLRSRQRGCWNFLVGTSDPKAFKVQDAKYEQKMWLTATKWCLSGECTQNCTTWLVWNAAKVQVWNIFRSTWGPCCLQLSLYELFPSLLQCFAQVHKDAVRFIDTLQPCKQTSLTDLECFSALPANSTNSWRKRLTSDVLCLTIYAIIHHYETWNCQVSQSKSQKKKLPSTGLTICMVNVLTLEMLRNGRAHSKVISATPISKEVSWK